jgi:hypothetical protein
MADFVAEVPQQRPIRLLSHGISSLGCRGYRLDWSDDISIVAASFSGQSQRPKRKAMTDL